MTMAVIIAGLVPIMIGWGWHKKMLDLPTMERAKVTISTLQEVGMIELNVEGMSCGHCVARVTKAVLAADSGAKVVVDLPSKTVKADSSADPALIASNITEAGYPATLKTA